MVAEVRPNYESDWAAITGGSGLGLATTRKLIEAHGDTLQVQVSPGVGTAFTVRLP